jgi:hypothetical protein
MLEEELAGAVASATGEANLIEKGEPSPADGA